MGPGVDPQRHPCMAGLPNGGAPSLETRNCEIKACERCVKLEQYNNEERRRDKAVVFSQEYLHCFGPRRRSQLLVRGVIRLAIDKLDARLISYLEPQEARGALEPPKGVAGILQAVIITRREGPVAGESRLLVCIYTALGL